MFETKISYLARSAHFETEKAFDTDFPVDHVPSGRRTNHKNDTQSVKIQDITYPGNWDLNIHGFCILNGATSLKAEDAFTRKTEVQQSYWYEIEALLHDKFPEYTRIECYDCTVRYHHPCLRSVYQSRERSGDETQIFQPKLVFIRMIMNSLQQDHTATDLKKGPLCNSSTPFQAKMTFGRTKILTF